MNNRTDLIVRVVSSSLIILFLIIGIISIIIAQGNIIDLRQGDIISTGSIKIITKVDDYKVELDNKEVTVSRDIVNNIKEGEHTIKIYKEGYSTWEGKIKVVKGLITDLRVHLFPNSLETQVLIDKPILRFFYSPDKKYLYYVENGDTPKLFRNTIIQSLFSIIETNNIKLADNAIKDLLESDNQITPSDNNEDILLEDYNLDNLAKLYNFSSSNFTSKLDELKIENLTLKDIDWLSADNTVLLITAENILLEYDLNNNEIYFINIFPESPNYLKYRNQIYYILNNNIYLYENKKSTKVDFFTDKTNEVIEFEKIIDAEENQILAVDSKQEIFFINIENKTILNFGKGTVVANSQNLLSFILDNETKRVFYEIKFIDKKPIISSMEVTIPDYNFSDITWSDDNSFFVFKKEGIESQLYASDKTSNNIVLILDAEQNQINDTVYISPENDFLIVGISNPEGDINLYKVGLQ